MRERDFWRRGDNCRAENWRSERKLVQRKRIVERKRQFEER